MITDMAEKLKRINILGEDYIIRPDNASNPKLIDANAYCELYSKEIVYDESLLDKNDCQKFNKLEEYSKKVLRHEAMHAIFFESGCNSWANNEELVDFIAVQYPKIKKIFDEIERAAI